MQQRHARLPAIAGLFFGLVGLALLAACIAPGGPTPPPLLPTLDVVGTVTAQALPVVSTQTALVASLTQVVHAQATLTAQAAVTQAALATATAPVSAAADQPGTATAIARAIEVQAATATSLAAANATGLAQAGTPIALSTPVARGTAVVVTATGSALTAASAVPPTLAPIPTQTLAPAASAPCVAVDAALASINDQAGPAGLDLGCPTAPANGVTGAFQEFLAIKANTDANAYPRSLMIWRGDTQEIYLVNGEDARPSRGSLQTFTDRYQEGTPEAPPSCAGLKAPAGYEQPIRGFGLIWCANHLNTTIGWPNRRETAVNLRIQPTRNGVLIRLTATEYGEGYLLALDTRAGRAVATTFMP